MVEVSNKLLQLIKYYLCFVYYCLLSTTSCTFYEQENVKKKRTVQCLVNQIVEVSNKPFLIEYYLCLLNLFFTLDKILSFLPMYADCTMTFAEEQEQNEDTGDRENRGKIQT